MPRRPLHPEAANDPGSLVLRTLATMAGRRKEPDAARGRLVFAHLDAAMQLRDRLREVLSRHRLSDLQFATLVVLLALEPQPPSTAAIAGHTQVSRSAMTEALDKLEALEFVTRIRSRRDRRVIHVQITKRGREAINAAIEDYLDAAAHAARLIGA